MLTSLAQVRHVLYAVGLGLVFALPSTAAEKIVFSTDWKAQAEHGGFYQAKAKGFYETAGLDVEIRMGGPGIDNQKLMAAGAVDMAVGSNNFFSMNLIQAGAEVRAVMASFQKDPQVLMTHPGKVDSFDGMKGLTMIVQDAATYYEWINRDVQKHFLE